jgi:aspartyl-tRNA(Asn)/glutamyl-tRNA(Gln) amidotransferase subunit B
MNWEVVIGLETHAQLTTVSKIFSGASTRFGAPPNTQASAIDLAMPGTLPVLNKGAVERAIRFGLAVGGDIAPMSAFERKNYFYPDLPKGYQISQYVQPVVSGGGLAIVVGDEERYVPLTRAHLEEDAGKLLHDAVAGRSGVDLNRAGTPLLEIVTEPAMRSAAEAVAYAKALHALVRWIGICDGNMQEGSFRCDANVSVRRRGDPLGTRCEIKNLNSFRFLEKAIEYEVRRQVEVIEDGGKVVQETRLFDPDRGETRPMRSKEDAQDYRYFPDPDLLPVEITPQWIEEVRLDLPELPDQMRERFKHQYRLTGYESRMLTQDLHTALYFEGLIMHGPMVNAADGHMVPADPKLCAHWVIGEVARKRNEEELPEWEFWVADETLGRILERVLDETISTKTARDIFGEFWDEDKKRGGRRGSDEVDRVIEAKGLRQISDSGALETAVREVLAAHPKLVDDYRAGKEKAFNALVGQVMKATKGKGNPQEVSRILRERLAS